MKSCPTLCDPVDCSLSGSSVHVIFQARILEWAAISFSTGSSQPRDRTPVSNSGLPHWGQTLTIWATREAQITEHLFFFLSCGWSILGTPDPCPFLSLQWNILPHFTFLSEPHVFWSLGSPGGSDGKESACNVRDLGSIPGLGRSRGEGNGNSLQYYCLENPMDKGAW